MESNNLPTGGAVFRQYKWVRKRLLGVCTICRNYEVSPRVVSSRRAHLIGKDLIPVVYYFQLLTGIWFESAAPCPASVVNLVHGLEHQPVAVILKIYRYLLPYMGKPIRYRFINGLVFVWLADWKPAAFLLLAGSGAVVVQIDNDFQSRLMRHPHNFAHPIQAWRRYPEIGSFADIPHPCYWNADYVKTGGLYPVHQLLVDRRIAPGRLASGTAVEGIKGIPQIPPSENLFVPEIIKRCLSASPLRLIIIYKVWLYRNLVSRHFILPYFSFAFTCYWR